MEKIRVLLVDDEENFRRAIARRLSKRGMLVEQAGTGEECLSILEKGPVDVVVLDVKMPGMNGFEVLPQIKKEYPGTGVILLTGHASVQDGVEGIKSGAFDYLTKPLEFEHLVCKIEQAYARTRQEEEKRDEAESRYQALLQSVTDYVIAINNNCQILMANNLSRNEFGMYQDGFCYRAWKKRDKKCEDCLVEKSFKDGNSRLSEEAVVMKDGRIARMLVKSTPVMNENGKIAYVLATATDITVKKRLEEEMNRMSGDLEEMVAKRLRELEKSEERYRTIFERSLDAIIHTDPKGRIMEINRAGLRILGYKTGDEAFSLGPAMDLFENRDDLYLFQKMLFREGFVTELETRLKGKKERSFDAVITSSVIFDITGQVTGYVMLIRDVTERKIAQEQIKRQNVRLATLNAISLTVSSSLDLKEVLNSTIEKILEIFGPDCVRIYLLDDKREILNLAAHRGFSAGFTEKSFMKSRRVGDGLLGTTALTRETRVVDNFLRSEDPYVDSIIEEGVQSTVYVPLVLKGESVGVMCVCSHSEFKFSEDYVEFFTAVGNQIGMAVHNAVLYEGTNRALQELKEAQEQVIRSEKLASLGKLSATIAHEINNPIAVVLTYIKLMMKLVSRGQFSEVRIEDISRYLETMVYEMTRCGEIVKNLLAFSRRNKIDIKPQEIDQIINRTLVLISHDLELKEIKLTGKIEPGLPKVKCDFRQIQQALLNLIGNASEAMENGGTLTVLAGRADKDGFIEIRISDTGCGISEQDQKSIFEPFFTTKEEEKGVGLGLSVVYGIITNHKGSIEVESEVGKGTTFKVLLPT
jgi:PAS domain S-box-containing protein